MERESKFYIQTSIEVPSEFQETWQKILDILAEIMNVPAALIMKVHPRQIEVFVKSSNKKNVYKEGEMAHLGTGFYCETVMATRNELLVPNALKDPEWDHNPDIELGMISYLGLPYEVNYENAEKNLSC